MKILGIDIGSSSCKIVVIDESGEIVYRSEVPHKNEAKATLKSMLLALKADEYLIGV